MAIHSRSRKTFGAVAAVLVIACSGGSKTTPGPVGPSRTLSGTATYDFVPAVYDAGTGAGGLNFAGAVPRPIRAATVQVVKGTAVIGTARTDATGHYSVTFSEPAGAGAPVLQVLAECTGPNIAVVDNTDGKSLWATGGSIPAGATTLDVHAAHGWAGSSYGAGRAAAPFAILDSMYTATRAFLAVRPAAVFPDLLVNWSPNNTNVNGDPALGQISTSHFSPSENQIYILGKDGVDTDEFDSHVIVHEWAHYFERNLSRSDSIGGPHGAGDVLDPRLAFGEGYGNALAAMLLPESLYVDTLWSGASLVASGFDAESPPSPTDDPNPSAFSEFSIMRLLYDLRDGGAAEGFDAVNLDLGVIYDVLAGPQRTTQAFTSIGSFIAGLKAQPSVDATVAANIDTLLAHYNIGPITDEWGTGDANLAGMYLAADPFPVTTTMVLGGTEAYTSNKWQQNQYYGFTGNGRNVVASATSGRLIALVPYQAGVQVATEGVNSSGPATVTIPTTNGKIYLVNLRGLDEATTGEYAVNLTFTSP